MKKAEEVDRTEQFVGREGQEKLRQLHVAVLGIGGLGTHVVQQLAFVRVGGLSLIDPGDLKASSRNRYVGSRWDDPVPGTPKVEIAKRLVHSIDPEIEVATIHDTFVSDDGFRAVIEADYVFGCLDGEGARLVLNELCAAYTRPYLDLATEIPPEEKLQFGGRVCTSWDGKGCLWCLGILDRVEAQRALGGPQFVRDRQRLYGVEVEELPGGGPAVVTLNGVVASLATTEFLVWATGLRQPHRVLSYRANMGKVMVGTGPPEPDCFYCAHVRSKRNGAGVERYLRTDVGAWLR